MRWVVYLLAGIFSLGFAYHFARVANLAASFDVSLVGVLCFLGFMFLGVVFFAVAYGFRFGQVSEVRGSLDCPVIYKNERRLEINSRIVFSNNPDRDSKLPASQQYVIFICGWRVFVCPATSFLR